MKHFPDFDRPHARHISMTLAKLFQSPRPLLKALYFAGPTWMFLTPEQMYGEEGKLRSAHKYYQNADIYFLTKMRKVRFKAAKSSVTADGRIKVVVSVGDPAAEHEEKTFVFPAVEMIYTMKHITEKFSTREEFFIHVLFHRFKPRRLHARLGHWLGRNLLKKRVAVPFGISLLKWSYGREVRVTHKTSYEISIEDPLARELTNDKKIEEIKFSNPAYYERMRTMLDADWDTEKLKSVNYEKLSEYKKGTFRLTVDQVINHFGMDVGPQEIVYIGKTEREPFKRLLPHEKLQELESKLLRNDGEAIVVHLFGFKVYDVIGSEMTDSVVTASEAITTVEAELINYFKPEMNDKYVDDAGKRSWAHIQSLTAQGYRQIATLLEIEGEYTKFVTEAVRSANPNQHGFMTDIGSLSRIVLL